MQPHCVSAAGICNISAELLKAGGEAMIRGLHAVLTAVWHSGNTLPPDWKKGLVVPIWKGKGDRQDCSNYLPWNNAAQRTRLGSCPFAADADPHSPAEASET